MEPLSSAGEIDRRVDQLLRDAGVLRKFPTPIEDIIATQRLAVSAPEESPLAPGMIARAPKVLRAKLELVSSKVLAVLDRRERMVHIAPDTDNKNHERFNKAHEVGHDLCKWQDIWHAIDGAAQLDPATQVLFEREANYAGARLLFQGPVFIELSQSYQIGMPAVMLLASQLGGSIHAAFHQYVTSQLDCVAGYVLRRSPTIDPATGELRFGVKQAMHSANFARTFVPLPTTNDVLRSSDVSDLEPAWKRISAGYDGRGEIGLTLRTGGKTLATFELFSNTYNVFLLINGSHGSKLARRVTFAGVAADVVDR